MNDETLEYLRDFDPRTVGEIPAGTRHCIHVFQTSEVDGGYVPSVVYENVSGHFPLSGNGAHAAPWVWGPTLEDARRFAEEANTMLGLSRRDASDIVVSSLRQHFAQERAH